MARPCSSHRRRPAPSAVHCPEDALTVLAGVTDRGRTAGVAVGAVDADRRPVALVVVDGATGRDLPTVVDAVLRGTAGATAAVFVASSGPGAVVPPEDLFTVVEHRCAAAGVALLEWFVPVGPVWVAVGEARGRPPVW
jgi:hypothetical protein